MSQRRSARGSPGLSKERIAACAVELADEEGLEALSMRKLAERLGVEAMSLYHHVPSKAALLDAMADELSRSLPPVEAGPAWRRTFAKAAAAWQKLALAHPGAFPLLATRSQATPELLERFAGAVAALGEAGFSPVGRARAVSSFFTALNGFLLAAGEPALFRDVPERRQLPLPELSEPAAAALRAVPPEAWVLSSDEAFQAHLELVLDGMEAALRREIAAPRKERPVRTKH